MKQCWQDGDLRAYIDGEMPEVAAHLEVCAACRARHRELAERATWVYGTMALADPVVAPLRRPVRWPWALVPVAAAVALAVVAPPPRPTVQSAAPEEFVRLDDDPIETATVVRVSTEDGIEADLIVGPDGRAHAIRVVSNP
jgi:hypothetical protein